jgi:hypothetical protein
MGRQIRRSEAMKTVKPTANELKEYMILSAYNMGYHTVAEIRRKTGLTRYYIKNVLLENNIKIENKRKAIGFVVNVLENKTKSYRTKFYSEHSMIKHIQKFSDLSESGIRARIRRAIYDKHIVLFKNSKIQVMFIDFISDDELEKYWEQKRAEFNPYKK